MKNIIYSIIIAIIPKGLKFRIQYPLIEKIEGLNKSYSQEGEDMVLARLLGQRVSIFFIDVGAHHPIRFSNTYKFYEKGIGRGVNIDALPGSMELFDKERPNDINIECGVGLEDGILEYYSFKEPALNTFEKSVAQKKMALGCEFREIIKLNVLPLSAILDGFEIPNKIDFLSIDVEGKDLEVLKSNNWKKYRPEIILVEDLNRYSLHELFQKSEVNQYLEDQNYTLISKTVNTLFYKSTI